MEQTLLLPSGVRADRLFSGIARRARAFAVRRCAAARIAAGPAAGVGEAPTTACAGQPSVVAGGTPGRWSVDGVATVWARSAEALLGRGAPWVWAWRPMTGMLRQLANPAVMTVLTRVSPLGWLSVLIGAALIAHWVRHVAHPLAGGAAVAASARTHGRVLQLRPSVDCAWMRRALAAAAAAKSLATSSAGG